MDRDAIELVEQLYAKLEGHIGFVYGEGMNVGDYDPDNPYDMLRIMIDNVIALD